MSARLGKAIAGLRARHGVDVSTSTALRARLEEAVAIPPHDDDAHDHWSDDALDALAARLRVGATRFHRDPAQDDALARWMAARDRRGGQVLSAGCSTGEEPYTLAMIAHEAKVDWRVTAIDAAPAAIETARAATYATAAIDALPARFRRHFVAGAVAGTSVVSPEIRARTRFEVGDALRLSTRARFDLVVCRNVAIYLATEGADRLMRVLASHLVDGGLLVVARAEVAIARRAGLRAAPIVAHGPVGFSGS